MAYILHIDTSADDGVIVISNDGVPLATIKDNEKRNHASSINLFINDALYRSGLTLGQIDAIAVCGGPGSYTGVRIALATAKGLCYALHIPLMMDNKLTLLAYKVFMEHGKKFEYYIPVIKARENEYFMCIYDNNFHHTQEPIHIDAKELGDIISSIDNVCIITNLQEQATPFINTNSNSYIAHSDIDPASWSAYSINEYKSSKFVNTFTATPFYMKNVFIHKQSISIEQK